MKRMLGILSVLLAAALLIPTVSAAAQTEDEIYAAATTEAGRHITLADAPEAEEMGDLISYELMIDHQPVLSVAQSGIADPASGPANDGYFRAEFDLPDTTKTVFLTGLSAGKVEEIQNRIIGSYVEGEDFELTDLSFIDAEKMNRKNDGDDELCWAAAASNVLTYTGWAAQAGFESADDVFEAFIDAFTDDGGNPYYGFGWFFNGVNTFPLLQSGVASATAGTGGYLRDYAYDQLIRSVEIQADGVNGMNALHQTLRDGCGVALSVSIYDPHAGYYHGGHTVTCWGYIADTAYRDSDPAYFSGLFLTDSDSDQPNSGDRRDAVNVLQAVTLTPGADDNGVLTFECDLDSKNHVFLTEFNRLLPYSVAIAKETDPAAARDKVNSPDLIISKLCLSADLSGSDYRVFEEKIETGAAFYYTPIIANEADADFSGRFGIAIAIRDADGRSVLTRTLTFNGSIPVNSMIGYGKALIKDSGLPAGDYTVSVAVNENHTASEAYYYNNFRSFSLKVRDSYLLGDTDNSGQIDIMDATQIQRILAGYTESDHDRAVQRAAITGRTVNIMDATQIQRHLASFAVGYPLGEKRLYD